MINGRKCWYEGKPGLSKAFLEWPAEAPLKAVGELAKASAPSPKDPLNAEAFAPTEPETFEALWQRRIKAP